MSNTIVEELRSKKANLNKEDLRQINNKLVAIKVLTAKINESKNQINKLVEEINSIINY